MILRGRCEGNYKNIGNYKEHVTTMWDRLSDRSRDAVKAARKVAKK